MTISANVVSGATVSTTTIPGPSPQQVDELRAAVLTTAKAWLTGTLGDVLEAQHGGCGFPEVRAADVDDSSWAAPAWRRLRVALQHRMGVSFASIKIRGVLVRNLSATGGEAEVQYDLPPSVAGDDNWMRYRFDGVRWVPIHCGPPIGISAEGRKTSSRNHIHH